MESQDSPGPPARPTGAIGSEDHVAISLVNLFRSSNSAALDSSSLGSHVDDDTSSFESREGISEEGRLALHLCPPNDSEDAGAHAVSSDSVDITDEDSNGAAIVGEKSPPGVWLVGRSAHGRELTAGLAFCRSPGSSHVKKRRRCSSARPRCRAAVSSRRAC
eukprot:365605-Chlamydomonas_euryale.AAC.13